MRRLTLVLAALALTGGCGGEAPPATAPGPPPSSAAALAEPKAGDCFDKPMRTTLSPPAKVDCAQEHQSEIAAVGTLTGVSSATPPQPNDPSLAAADADCRTKTAAFLGTPLGRHGATLEIGLPADRDWQTGSRWYACEAVVVDAAPGRAAFATTRGTLAGGRTPLPQHCFNLAKAGTTAGMTETPCTGRHAAQYMGAVRAGFAAPVPADDETWKPYAAACRDEVADQMGVTAQAVDDKWGYDGYRSQELHGYGVTVTQCYFVLWQGRTMTGSVAGTRGNGVPLSNAR
ncbi:septum formation family protein [Dactylosporangium sp. CA-139114]|uniref:septum formation family protein n=1 Tax=Dactylosporangium sp. CA-139114 TaxID=3239931 RepID=UPI003D9744D5